MSKFQFTRDTRDCVEQSLSHYHTAKILFDDQRYVQTISNLYYSVLHMCRAFIVLQCPLRVTKSFTGKEIDPNTHSGMRIAYSHLYNAIDGQAIVANATDRKPCIGMLKKWHNFRLLPDYKILRDTNANGIPFTTDIKDDVIYDLYSLNSALLSIPEMSDFMNAHIAYLNNLVKDFITEQYVTRNFTMPALSPEDMYLLDRRNSATTCLSADAQCLLRYIQVTGGIRLETRKPDGALRWAHDPKSDLNVKINNCLLELEKETYVSLTRSARGVIIHAKMK